ncbi:MAG: TonB-dependent receptor, partial [Bacteroidetes bacterium]
MLFVLIINTNRQTFKLMKKNVFILSFVLFPILLFSQKYTISGYISDAENSEKLIGANVFHQESKSGTITNSYGFYSITLPKGKVKLVFSFVGYLPITKEINLGSNQIINIDLQTNIELGEVEVVADKIDVGVESSQMSTIVLPIKTIKAIPALLGEVDIIKALQLLPGVQSGTEGSSGMYVRGGGPDQNLILL